MYNILIYNIFIFLRQNGYMTYDPLAMQQQQTQTTANPGFAGGEDYTHYPYPDEYMSRQYLQQPRSGSQPPRQTDCKFLRSSQGGYQAGSSSI